MRIVDDGEDRGVLRRLRQQAEGADEHSEPVDVEAVDAVLLAERRTQCPSLARRKPPERGGDRSQQAVQRGERQRRLRLDTLRPQQPHALGRSRRLGQQRRLPHPRLTPQHQRPAPRGPGPVDERGDGRQLGVATVQHVLDPMSP